MSYNLEGKKELDQVVKEIREVRRSLKNVNNTIDSLGAEIADYDRMLAESLERDRQAAEEAHLLTYLRPLHSKRDALQAQLKELEENHSSDMSQLTFDLVYDELKESDVSYSKFLSVSDDLEKSVITYLGDRFYKEYYSQIEIKPENLSSDEIDAIMERCKSLHKKSEKFISKAHQSPDKTVAGILDSFNLESLKDSSGGVAKVAGASVLLLVASWFIFPVYLFLILAKGIQNLRSSFYLSQLVMGLKLLEGNRKALEDSLVERANEKLRELTSELVSAYEDEKKKLDMELDTVLFKIEHAREDCMKSFVFNEDQVREKYQKPLEIKKREYEQALRESTMFTKRQQELELKHNSLSEQLEKDIEQYIASVLDPNRIGSDYVLDTTFLIDKEGTKPVFFEFPLDSSYFFYEKDKQSVMLDFLKLIMFQLRGKIAPANLSFRIWDLFGMGMDFMSFYQENRSAVRIVETEEQLEEDIVSLMDAIRKRSEVIKRDFNNIQEYNTFMLQIESVAESYMFVPIINPSETILKHKELPRILEHGPDLGIYPMIFQRDVEVRDDIFPLFAQIGKAFRMYEEIFEPMAKSLMLERLCQLTGTNPEEAKKIAMLT